MSILKSAVFASFLSLTLSAPASLRAIRKPGIFDVITLDNIAESLASVGITALRSVMEVEYEHLSTNVMRGTVSLSGVTLRPQLPYDRAGQCEITVQRASFDLRRLHTGSAASNASIALTGAEANLACLPREASFGTARRRI